MNGKVPFTLLCFSVLAFACGPRSHSEGTTAATETRRATAPTTSISNSNSPLAPTLDVQVSDRVHFAFSVVNASKKKLEVNFPDGQTHEVVVLDSLGREVWRWSEGRLFTQAMQNKVLRTSDQLEYDEEWRNPAPGTYVAVARLASVNYPVEQRVEFTVRQ
jgi:hypothetical protein